jgi:hypothetical protein
MAENNTANVGLVRPGGAIAVYCYVNDAVKGTQAITSVSIYGYNDNGTMKYACVFGTDSRVKVPPPPKADPAFPGGKVNSKGPTNNAYWSMEINGRNLATTYENLAQAPTTNAVVITQGSNGQTPGSE